MPKSIKIDTYTPRCFDRLGDPMSETNSKRFYATKWITIVLLMHVFIVVGSSLQLDAY